MTMHARCCVAQLDASLLSPNPPCVSVGQAKAALKGEDTSAEWSGLVGGELIHLFLIADGHGGVEAAAHCANTVLDNVRRGACEDPRSASWRAACAAAFLRAHAEVRALPDCRAGCTLSVCCLNVSRSEITCCNVGDSAVYMMAHSFSGEQERTAEPTSLTSSGSYTASELSTLDISEEPPPPPSPPLPTTQPSLPPPPLPPPQHEAHGSNSSKHGGSLYNGFFFARAFNRETSNDQCISIAEPEELSEDHRLERCLAEQQRIRSLGGMIARAIGPSGLPDGPLRVWPGGLAVARVVGDADCGVFASAEPAIRSLPIPPGGASLLLCSDGVWDCCTPAKVAQVVRRGLQRRPHSVQPKLLAQQIVAKAVHSRGGVVCDDTTCIVVHITPPDLQGHESASSSNSSVPIMSRARSFMGSFFLRTRLRSLSSSAKVSPSGHRASTRAAADDAPSTPPTTSGTARAPFSQPPTMRFSPSTSSRWRPPSTLAVPMHSLDSPGGGTVEDYTEVEPFVLE